MTVKIKHLGLMLLLLSGSMLMAQATDFTTTRRLGFNNSTKTQTVEIDTPKNSSSLGLQILCTVKNGAVKIEIFNPSGKKEGEFSVESTENEGSNSLFDLLDEGVSGEINKMIYEPHVGSWKIKFIPENATGKVQIVSRLIIVPGEDR